MRQKKADHRSDLGVTNEKIGKFHNQTNDGDENKERQLFGQVHERRLPNQGLGKSTPQNCQESRSR